MEKLAAKASVMKIKHSIEQMIQNSIELKYIYKISAFLRWQHFNKEFFGTDDFSNHILQLKWYRMNFPLEKIIFLSPFLGNMQS